jgi:hypothetical protein
MRDAITNATNLAMRGTNTVEGVSLYVLAVSNTIVGDVDTVLSLVLVVICVTSMGVRPISSVNHVSHVTTVRDVVGVSTTAGAGITNLARVPIPLGGDLMQCLLDGLGYLVCLLIW